MIINFLGNLIYKASLNGEKCLARFILKIEILQVCMKINNYWRTVFSHWMVELSDAEQDRILLSSVFF